MLLAFIIEALIYTGQHAAALSSRLLKTVALYAGTGNHYPLKIVHNNIR